MSPIPYSGSERGGIFFNLLSLFFLGLLCIAVYVLRVPILQAAGRFWVVEDPPVHSDAIIIFGDDNFYSDRAERAAEIFRQGWAPHIVASGRYLRPYISIADLMQRDLKERGVPGEAIIPVAHHAENTLQEAGALAPIIRQNQWHRILIVTSNFHTRRARYICERVFPQGTEIRTEPARDADYDPDSWWKTRLGIKLFFHEGMGMPLAMWELRGSPETAAAP
jgi:uncharacterized SAM-binding protein YcdF (DUF218 family)